MHYCIIMLASIRKKLLIEFHLKISLDFNFEVIYNPYLYSASNANTDEKIVLAVNNDFFIITR